MQALHLFNSPRKKPIHAILLFCLPLFFLLLADSTMSYIFPILVENNVNSNLFLGIIMALSSISGIICDFTFPQILKGRTWKFQLTVAIILAVFFPIFTHLGAAFAIIVFFIMASLIWGTYYEFMSFAQQNFIVDEEKTSEYSKDWGIIYFIYEVTFIIGPILGSLLLNELLTTSNAILNFFQILSLILCVLILLKVPGFHTRKNKLLPIENKTVTHFNMLRELKYWRTLGKKIWPIIICGITITSVSATYWTIGGLFGQQVAGESGLGWLIIILFSAPMLIGSLILARISIRQRKKRLSNISLMVGGILMSGIYFVQNNNILLFIIIALSSFTLSFAGPLNDAVYSDLLDRMGKSRLHLVGLSKANASLAYIIAPMLSGYLADSLGYHATFAIVGVCAAVIGFTLILVTPRKLKLPQKELGELDHVLIN
jgi:MFS family permease